MLIADYIIAAILIIVLFICIYINGAYVMETTNKMIEAGFDVSMIPTSLVGFTVVE